MRLRRGRCRGPCRSERRGPPSRTTAVAPDPDRGMRTLEGTRKAGHAVRLEPSTLVVHGLSGPCEAQYIHRFVEALIAGLEVGAQSCELGTEISDSYS